MDSVLIRCEYSAHSPFTELHGILRDCVPILTNLLISSYFSSWLGIYFGPESVGHEDELNSSIGGSEFAPFLECKVFAYFFQDFVW